MPKCHNCGMRLQNCRAGDRLRITDEPSIRCVYCLSVHSWATGFLIGKRIRTTVRNCKLGSKNTFRKGGERR